MIKADRPKSMSQGRMEHHRRDTRIMKISNISLQSHENEVDVVANVAVYHPEYNVGPLWVIECSISKRLDQESLRCEFALSW